MPKGNSKGVQMGNQAAQSGLDQNSALSKRAMSLQDTLEPALWSSYQNPQGFGAGELNAMNTAAQQGAGGATAGAVGAMGRQAARTRNRGSFTAAADEAARSGQREASQRGVEIQGANAKAKMDESSEALSGLRGLFGSDLSGSLQALGLVPGGINAANNSRGPSFLDSLGQLSGIAANAGKAASGFASI